MLTSLKLILIIFACLFAVRAQGKETERPVQAVWNVISFAYEKECGNPVGETGGWASIFGTVVSVEDGRTFSLLDRDGRNRRVTIYAVDVSRNPDAAKRFLDLVINGREVEVTVPDERKDEFDLIGKVRLRGERLIEVNQHMLKRGIAEFTEMPFKTYYEPCLHRMLEKEAKDQNLGIWASVPAKDQ